MFLFQESNKLAVSQIRSGTQCYWKLLLYIVIADMKKISCFFIYAGRGQPTTLWWPALELEPPLWTSVIKRFLSLESHFWNILENSWDILGIIVFSWNAQTALWMLLRAKLNWHTNWVTQHHMHIHVYADSSQIYATCNMCSMDLIKKSPCLSLCTSILVTDKDTKIRNSSVTRLSMLR